MSRETRSWKRNNILCGFTESRGHAWWTSRGMTNTITDDGRPNHFEGAVPIERVMELFPDVQEVPLLVPNVANVQETVEDVSIVPENLIVPDRKAIVRCDNGDVLGVFKSGYEIHQYKDWLVTHLANILDDELHVGSAGLLQGGAVGWVSVEIPDNIVTPEGVAFRPNLFAVTSMNGTMATMFKRTVTHIVCDNTLDIARTNEGEKLKFKHTAYSIPRIADTRTALNIVHSGADEFAAEVKALCAQKVTAKHFSKWLDVFSPVPSEENASKRTITLSENRRAVLTNMWKSDPRVHPWANTAFGVVQLVNTYDQHFSAVKQNLSDDSDKAAFRFERSIIDAVKGDTGKRTDEVLGMLRQVIAA